MKLVKIFDTTLRDGEQTPGAGLNVQDKVQIALQLERLGVDVIEAGFAIASPDDFKAISLISKRVEKSIICSLSRALDKDIDMAAKSLKNAQHPRIHTFIGTSPSHIQHILKKSRQEVLKMAVHAVRRARSYVDDVEFSPMDASRTDMDYLCDVIKAVIKAGATTVNIPDTVGCAVPSEWHQFIKKIAKRIPQFKKGIVLSVHCHNDLGLATANSLAAIEAGACQVECAVNGLGERGGNAALEEVVMALQVRQRYFGVKGTRVNTKEIYPTSQLVSKLTGIVVQPNKAIVGKNAFAHESGIHQDGVLKERKTFEIMRAEDVGWVGKRIVLGKLSGRHALKRRLQELGIDLDDAQLLKCYNKFIKLADQKKRISDKDLKDIAVSLLGDG